MKYNLDEIKKKLNDLTHEKKSEIELGEWAKEAYYDLLTGGYLEIEKLKCYPFIKTLSKIHIIEDDDRGIYPCKPDEVILLRDILNGEVDKAYSITVGIQWQIKSIAKHLDIKKKEACKRIIDILSKYSNRQEIEETHRSAILDFLSFQDEDEDTIQYIVDRRIKTFLSENMDWEDNCIDIQNTLWICANVKPTHEDLQNKILRYLEFYIGKRDITIEFFFRRGNVEVLFDI